MLNIRYCKKCKEAYDFMECPYCREEELKKRKKRENGYYPNDNIIKIKVENG